jgi:hypothetical protein
MPRKLHIAAPRPKDELQSHWENFLAAVAASDPVLCHCPLDLAAAAATTSLLAAESYRRGKVVEWQDGRIGEGGNSLTRQWELTSREQATSCAPLADAPRPPAFQKLAGPWRDDRTDPAA